MHVRRATPADAGAVAAVSIPSRGGRLREATSAR